MTDTATIADDKIGCKICGSREHSIQAHLKDAHPDVTLEMYRTSYPDAPIFSPKMQAAIDLRDARAAAQASRPVAADSPAAGAVMNYFGGFEVGKGAMHEIFELGAVKAALSHKNGPVPISVVKAPEHLQIFVPDRDPNYIFPIALLKSFLLGLELNKPTMGYGHSGTGKSTIWEQVCARTGRPMLRVQHTNNMEESHVIGGWRVKDGATVWEHGPLPFAMLHGLVYLADEYDRARPGVLALYQPVLEGKPLVIKEADNENRVIKPHPLFRIVATGNTNGTGDESGLYQGTIMQDSANMERFGIMEEVGYPERKTEILIVSGQGAIPTDDAEKFVTFAHLVREGFSNGKIGLSISPRALINAAQYGKRVGSLKRGLEVSYLNRLTRIDRETATELLGRIAIA